MSSKIITYKGLRKFVARARDPRVGRSIDSNTRTRLMNKANGDEYVQLYGRYTHKAYAEFYPDDTVTLVCDVQSVDRRVFRPLHPIEALAKTGERRSSIRYVLDDGVEYFPGLRIDMRSGEYLNQRPPLRERIRKEENAVWRKKSAAFRRAVRLRAKMGIIAAIWNDMAAVRAKDATKFDPIRSPKDDVAVLYRVMNESDMSTQALQYFCLRYRWERGFIYDHAKVSDMLPVYVDSLVNRYRDELRDLFNVYEDA